MGPTTRICKTLGLAALLLLAEAPAIAVSSASLRQGPATFVAAWAAAAAGDPRRASRLYASLAKLCPGNTRLAELAFEQAIQAGDMGLAERLLRETPRLRTGLDGRLLALAERLSAGDPNGALALTKAPGAAMLRPFVEAWLLAGRGRFRQAEATLGAIGGDHPLRTLVPEQLSLFQSVERTALLTFTATRALSRLSLRLAADIESGEDQALAIGLAQVANHADPGNEPATILLGRMLADAGRDLDALAMLRRIPPSSPLLSKARDAEVEVLLATGRAEEALARARAFLAAEAPTPSDWMRLGDVLDGMDRPAEAAVAYGSALVPAAQKQSSSETWRVHLLRGAALERAKLWPQAEHALELALSHAPSNPIVLNYLGYARLERGERLDDAEAMIAEASRRAPDNASITDSLGWAQFKRGRVGEAITTLQRAAAADPAQAEIHEHLGDALYSAGRKFEARFAWNAALITASDAVKGRVEAKIAVGLSAANAAP